MGTAVATAALGLGLALSPAQAVTFNAGFTQITSNGNLAVAGQLNVQVSNDAPVPAGSVSFLFTNVGSIASSITDIYFEAPGLFTGSMAFTPSGGVLFAQDANPGNLPGANGADPNFVTSVGLSANSEFPVTANGINPGKSLIIVLTLASGVDLDGLSGNLRIGLHVQGINGASKSFVTGPIITTRSIDPVPLPAGVWLFGTALAGLGALKLRRRRKAPSAA